jgi:hypothetical protein
VEKAVVEVVAEEKVAEAGVAEAVAVLTLEGARLSSQAVAFTDIVMIRTRMYF